MFSFRSLTVRGVWNLLLVLLILSCCVFLCACRRSSRKDRTVVMVTDPNFPPFDFMANGEIAGVDVDIVRSICRKLDMRLKVRRADFDSLISIVSRKDAHIAAAGITITPERKRYVLFSVPYRIVSQLIIVRSNDPRVKEPEDLKQGLRIGCHSGTTGAEYLRREIIPEPNSPLIVEFPDGAAAAAALNAGQVDAVVLDDAPARSLASLHAGALRVLEIPLTQEEYAIAFSPDEKELCAAFDKVIVNMKKYGEIELIFQRNQELLQELQR